jgi:hypothetical protein
MDVSFNEMLNRILCSYKHKKILNAAKAENAEQ